MRTISILIGAFLFAAGLYATESPAIDLKKFDTNGDGRLSEAEIITLFLTTRNLTESPANSALASDFASDMVSFRCISCDSVPLADAAAFLAELERVVQSKMRGAVDKQRRIGWAGLGFGRFVVDTVNPRPAKFKAPMVFSYRHDSEADDDEDGNQFNILGALQLWKRTWDFDETGASSLTLTPGIDFDVVGSKPASETTITIAARGKTPDPPFSPVLISDILTGSNRGDLRCRWVDARRGRKGRCGSRRSVWQRLPGTLSIGG
jgi:hypothetical protein